MAVSHFVSGRYLALREASICGGLNGYESAAVETYTHTGHHQKPYQWHPLYHNVLIQNTDVLGRTKKIQNCLAILESGLAAADPSRIMPLFVKPDHIRVGTSDVHLDGYDSIHTIAFGKAADSMSRAVSRILSVRSGMVVVPKDSQPRTLGHRIRVYRAAHPVPDRQSVAAAKAVCKFLADRRKGEFVLFLVSGGASSLLALPDGITLQDKAYVTGRLMGGGASISEINCVRKHLSAIKGGRLLEGMPCDGAALLMSDVEGDDVGTIASGTTYMDPTTFADALDIMTKYDMTDAACRPAMDRLCRGRDGNIPETPKAPKIPHGIVANNDTCVNAMTRHATILGYDTRTVHCFGGIDDAAQRLGGQLPAKRSCLIFGGEPTIHVTGNGRGGRNQELVLRLQTEYATPRIVVASMGTDGIDGNSRAAGAVVQGPPKDVASARSAIHNNDSYSHFQRYGGLIMTGHTGTNLLDIGIILG